MFPKINLVDQFIVSRCSESLFVVMLTHKRMKNLAGNFEHESIRPDYE